MPLLCIANQPITVTGGDEVQDNTKIGMSMGASSQKFTRFPQGQDPMRLYYKRYYSTALPTRRGVTGVILVNWLFCSLGRIICIKLVDDLDPKIN